MNIGRAIRLCRQRKGLRQADLAKKASISMPHLSLLERNEREPSLSTLNEISDALNIPLSVLFFLSSDKEELEDFTPEVAEKLSWITFQLMHDDD